MNKINVNEIETKRELLVENEKYKTLFRLDFLEIYFSWNYKHTCGDNSNVRSI